MRWLVSHGRAAGTWAASLLLLLNSACGTPAAASRSSSPVDPTAGQSGAPAVALLRYAWPDVGFPTPFRISTAGPGGPALLSLIYDTLTWKDERGIIPWLATGWNVSSDGRTYTFTLAQNVKWQDGAPLTAQDVAFSFRYYAKHPYSWANVDMVQSAEADGPNTVRLALTQPFAPFLENVAGSVPIIPEHVWSRVADPVTYSGTDATVGSGPYKLVEYRPADGAYRLQANPGYFRGRVKVGELQQLNVPSQSQIQAIQQGQLDLALTMDASVSQALGRQGNIKVFATAPLSVVRLALNTERAPLDDVSVRQGLAYALDRTKLAELITKGIPVVGGLGAIPPGTPWFAPDLPSYPYDPNKARELLAGRSLNLELLADPSNREPELMQPMLQAVGVNLSVKRLDAKTRTQLLREKDFSMGLEGHIGVGGDPDFLRQWYSGGESNDFAQGDVFRNAQLSQLGDEEAQTLNPDARKPLVYSMQRIIAGQLPTIVLYYRPFYWVYDSSKLRPMNTWDGLLNGAPLVLNKLTLLATAHSG